MLYLQKIVLRERPKIFDHSEIGLVSPFRVMLTVQRLLLAWSPFVAHLQFHGA